MIHWIDPTHHPNGFSIESAICPQYMLITKGPMDRQTDGTWPVRTNRLRSIYVTCPNNIHWRLTDVVRPHSTTLTRPTCLHSYVRHTWFPPEDSGVGVMECGLYCGRAASGCQQSVALLSLDGVQPGQGRKRANAQSIPACLPSTRQRAGQAVGLCTRLPQTVWPLSVEYQDTR